MTNTILMTSEIINEALEVLKQHKAEGRKIVGVAQHGMFPDELVLAAGAIPVRLILGGRDEQELGDQYLSATTCPFGRSTLGFFEKKHPLYSLIDTVIAGTFCNGVQNIANYLYYFNIPTFPLILPHDCREKSFNFYVKELKKLQEYLEKFTGNRCTSQTFMEAIEKYNQMRTLLRKINDYRLRDNPPVCGTMIHKLVSQAFLLGPKAMIPRCQKLIKELEAGSPNYSGVRVFITGSGVTLGDSIFEVIEEQCGGLVVADDLWSSMDYFLEDVDLGSADPLIALADRYLRRNLCGRMIPESEIRVPKVIELYHLFHAEGVIYHTLKFCDSYSSLKPEFKKTMNRQHIPLLDLDRDYAESNIGQIETRIEAFLEMIS